MADAPGGTRRLIHDLRSPLMVIDGFAALLADDEGSLAPEQRADYARRIRVAANDMRTLLDRAAAEAHRAGEARPG